MTYTRTQQLEDRMESVLLGIRLYEEKPETRETLYHLTNLRNEFAKAQHEYAELTGHAYEGRRMEV